MADVKQLDAIALLKQDHRAVGELFAQFETASGDGRKQTLAQQICLELSVHTMIEETIFYPAVSSKVEDDLMDESHVEHDSAKMLIASILESKSSDKFFDAKVTVLSEVIKHHVKEEEQRGGMFTQAKKSKVDFVELRAVMEARKEELAARYKKEGIPTQIIRAVGKPRVQVVKTID